MSFLSREHDDDILMRLRSEAITKELLAMGEFKKFYLGIENDYHL
jgi:hypothetical protein